MHDPLRVLFDGWSYVHHPGSPAALHLLAILENLPEEVQPVVALPESPPEWFPSVPFEILKTPLRDQFTWEQRGLPRLARRLDAQLLHLFSASAPLVGRSLAIVSPSGFDVSGLSDAYRSAGSSLGERLRQSIRLGGLSRARLVFWPDDMVSKNLLAPFQILPPCVYSGFLPDAQLASEKRQNGSARAWNEVRQLDLPETYLLYHGPASTLAINRLLDAWHWAYSPIGNYHPLLLLGFTAEERIRFDEIAKTFDFGDTVRVLPVLSPLAVALLYQGCTALFHPAPEPMWGGPIRHALASGKPVIASQHLQTSSLVGPAAYLAAEDDSRALGAALITVVVEEEVAGRLAQAARKRAAAWTGAAYSKALFVAYRKILES
jgi:glycosyltransferase involved in cell wall biosynthesis